MPRSVQLPLFVYGTLLHGTKVHDRLLAAIPLGSASTAGRLYDLGDYPAMVVARRGRVFGELLRCSAATLARLDQYEGVYEGLFRRQQVQVEAGDCWAYVAGPLLLPRLTPDIVISSGRWADANRSGGAGDTTTQP